MLNRKKLLEHAEIAVQRLMMQYNEYLLLDRYLRQIEEERFVRLADLAKQTGKPVSMLRDTPPDESAALVQTLQQRVSDEMTFANPLIWMMYKHRAYKDTSQEIATLDDLRRHCAPADYVCGKRFRFFNLRHPGVLDAFAPTTQLNDVYLHDSVLAASQDHSFMQEWQTHEYAIADNRIAKWVL